MTPDIPDRIYDWAGVLIDISGWKKFFEEQHTALYHQYEVKGKVDLALRKKVRPQVLEIYEDAVANARFDAPLFNEAITRLYRDRESGSQVYIFTSSPPAPFEKQIESFGIGYLVNEAIFLEDIQKRFGNVPLTKEEPAIFKEMLEYLVGKHRTQWATYVDDSLPRVEAAVKGRTMSPAGNHLNAVYHLDRKAEKTSAGNGYITINSLLSI